MEQTLLGKVIVVDTIQKFGQLMMGVKTTPFLYLQLYSDINKLDEKVQEIAKLVDNNKD